MTKGGRDTGRFWDWSTNKAVTRSFSQADLTELDSIMTETHVRELAYYTCVGLIARMVSKCEFQTLSRGSPVRESEWYAWNVSPNANQNSSQFMSKLIHKLYSEQCAALVVDIGGQLLVADSYSLEERALADSVFSGITVDGYTLSDTLPASQVLYFKQTPYNMRMLTNLLYETYGKLISYNAKSYQASRARKGVLTFETQQSNKVEDAKQNMEILQQRFKPFMGSGDAVLPLYRGESYTDISGSKTYTQETTRDLRAMIDDVLTYDARALGIPPALIHGDIAGIRDAVRLCLTSCIDPLCDMLSEEINRKRYGREAVLRGDGVRIDTSSILHVDVVSDAPNLEKLVSSGLYSVNGVRGKLGEPLIDEPWANEHYITKNYSEVQGDGRKAEV